MRNAIVALMIFAALSPMVSDSATPLDEPITWFAEGSGVEILNEVEPNNANTSGQEVYPGDVVRGSVDMWADEHDWFSVWLEPGQTLLLTLSHASGDGVSMSVWDEENTHYNTSNPSKTRDTIFLGEDETSVGGVYSVSINATMTEAGGGAYVLEIDAGYEVQWYSPAAGWYVAADTYNAKGEIMYTSELSSYQFANADSTNDQTAPVWTNGDYWNASISMPEFFGMTYDEYHQMTVTGTDTVSGKECYRVSIAGKSTLTVDMMGMETKTITEETGEACYAVDTLSLVHENLTISNSMETSGGFGSSSDTSGRSCTDDQDCDGVEDFFDDCPNTALGAEVDWNGCSDEQLNGGGGGGSGSDDTDGDGIPDSNDNCPNEAATAENDADSDGCPDENGGGGDGSGSGTADADNDGVNDDEDSCPNTPAGEAVDMMGCSSSQGGGGNGGGGDGSGNGGGGDGSGNGGGGNGMGGGGGSIEDGCIPMGIDQSSTMTMDLTFASGVNELNFPMSEGKVWSEATEGSGTLSMEILMGGCTILDIEFEDSGALPLNYRHLGTQSFEVGGTNVVANGIQSFAGREGNNDWATPDFTLLPSVPDDVARMGLPFAAWVTTVGFNDFNGNVNLSASVNAANAPISFSEQMLSIDELGAVVVDTMNITSGEYVLTITGSNDGFDRSVTVPFTVDNDPDFSIETLDPWIMVPGGVPWVVATPIFVEPVNGFGADVSLSVVIPEGIGVVGELDFARGTAPFMAVLTLTFPDNLTEGDYTVVVSGKAGDTVRSDEITLSVTSIPDFSVDIENREQMLTDGAMSLSGAINAHNGLDLNLGGTIEIIIEPYNEALLESAVITWGAIDANGDLTFDVAFNVDNTIPQHNYTVQLLVLSLDGGLAHSASAVFVTESSTLDGTAEVADESVVVSGNTDQHDGTDTAAEDVGENTDDAGTDDNDDDKNDSESQSSNTILMAGSAIGVLGIIIGVAVVVLRGRGGEAGKDFSNQLWTDGTTQPMAQHGMMPQQTMATQAAQPMVQQPVQPAQPMAQQPFQATQPMVQQPVQATQPVQPAQPMQTAPAPPAMATAPPPPAQPTTVADYTGLPPGGTYDQSTGQTVYIQTDGVRWQMMPDGSFNRL